MQHVFIFEMFNIQLFQLFRIIMSHLFCKTVNPFLCDRGKQEGNRNWRFIHYSIVLICHFYCKAGLLSIWKWEVPIKVWDRSQRKKWSSGCDPRVHNMRLKDWSLRILRPIQEQHFMRSGINLRTSKSFLWDLMVIRSGKSMGHRLMQGLEIGLALSI